MSTIQVQATLSKQELLKATQQLNIAELKEFMAELSTVYAQRQTPHLSQRETELLKKISAGLPEITLFRFQELRAKTEAETITEAERAELSRLVDEVEKFDTERLAWLIELAQLRNQTVPELIDLLGLHPQNA